MKNTLYSFGGMKKVREFTVRFRSLRDVQDFVALASKQTVKLCVGGDRFQVNATSFMGIFALNCRKPLRVTVNCTEEELARILVTFDRFLVT
jgi:phosphotransferase system HPr-like phosphotransfer protein